MILKWSLGFIQVEGGQRPLRKGSLKPVPHGDPVMIRFGNRRGTAHFPDMPGTETAPRPNQEAPGSHTRISFVFL